MMAHRRWQIVRHAVRAVVLLLFTLRVGHGDEPCNEPELLVGAAAINLKADDSMVIGGSILPRYARGQEGELRAVAVVIERPGGGGTLAIVACDVLFVTRDFVDPAVAEIARRTGIPEHAVLVNATHTHHAPSTAVVHGYGREEAFVRQLQRAIVEAVVEAHRRRAPACFYFHLGEERTVGGNSRRRLPDGMITWLGPRPDQGPPTGPFDPEMPVLAFKAPDGTYRAIIYNHSTHTIGTRRGNVRSPSFYGLAAQELEKELGTTVCFLEGASGSTHNITGVPVAEAVRRFKQAIRRSLQQLEHRSVHRLAALKRPFVFTVRRFDEEQEDRKVVRYCRKYAGQRAEAFIRVFRDMRRVLAEQQGQKRTTWLQVMAIDDVAIAGVPAEYFTGLGIRIKKESPYRNTLVAELANDWIGYLPDREAHRLGGYQTWMGFHSYAEIGTGERVAETVTRMFRELRAQE